MSIKIDPILGVTFPDGSRQNVASANASTTSFTGTAIFNTTGAVQIPYGTTAQRPTSPPLGTIRYNTTLNGVESYDGSQWLLVGETPGYYAQFLTVAGGGGGGMDMGGGGGGGGVVPGNIFVATGVQYTVVVGGGGTGAPAGGTNGQPSGHQFTIRATAGSNSTITASAVSASIIAMGGGYGGSSHFPYTPDNGYGGQGANGGGASGYSDGNTGRSGPGRATQGYINGAATTTGFRGGGCGGQYYAGGGGGAGGQGVDGPSRPDGGIGVFSDILGTGYYWGGGGGGGSYSLSTGGYGGNGGGGGGSVGTAPGGAGLNAGSPGGGGSPNTWTNTPGGDGGTNTGGGGGGGGHYNSNNKGGNGGSGIVVIRYPGAQRASGGTVTSANGFTIHRFTTTGSFTYTG